jgi:hypothetical protein
MTITHGFQRNKFESPWLAWYHFVPVQIDKAHRLWFYFSVIVVIGAGVMYGVDLRRGRAAVFGTSGGSAVGLTFGIASFVLLLFAAGRGLGRWMPGGMGSAAFWGRAHVWLGLLVLPLAWFHGGVHHGSPLSAAMMWLLYAIIITGFASALLRHYLSQPTSGRLPGGLIDAPIDEAILRLGVEAGEVAARCDQIAEQSAKGGALRGGGGVAIATVIAAPPSRYEALKEMYVGSIQAYLAPAGEAGILANRMRATQMFRRCRTLISDEFHGPLVELERICDVCRRLRSRQRLGLWVDRLMLVHVPLSTALIVLVALHAVGSLRYSSLPF